MDTKNECQGFTKKHYCTKDLTSADSKPCFSDSGGPLFFRENYDWVIYGIVSFGIGKSEPLCENLFVTIFTMVPFNLNWILHSDSENLSFGQKYLAIKFF